MEQIPDDPIIRSIQRSGYPPWLEQEHRPDRAALPGRPARRPCPSGPWRERGR